MRAILVGSVIFVLLWVIYLSTIRAIYVPNPGDIPALADGLLLAPGARWQDWFTRGYSDFFDLYPDRPAYGREATVEAFTRPAFQFLIYLAHFPLGKDWASYQLINCFAAAGMGAIAFQIARTALALRTPAALVAAMLVVLSPPVLESWLLGVGFAIEPLASVIVGAACLASLARRDLVCLALLFTALLTKENTVWAPVAAALSVMLRPKLGESLPHRAFIAATMLIPILVWLGLRFVYFGGIGGTYGTAGYTPLIDFIKLSFFKLTHVHYLFVTHQGRPGAYQERPTALVLLDRGTALVIYALILLWMLRIFTEGVERIGRVPEQLRWPDKVRRWLAADADSIVALWAAMALAFQFAIPLPEERYATSVVIFAWPALVAEVERRGKTFLRLGLVLCCVVSISRSSYRLVEWINDPLPRFNAYRFMTAALQQVPSNIREIYVFSAAGLQEANPKYVRLMLGLSPKLFVLRKSNGIAINQPMLLRSIIAWPTAS